MIISLILILATMTAFDVKNESVDLLHDRISKTATILLNGNIDVVFPLFGPIKEIDWAPGWKPKVIYSESGNVEEHMIFRSKRNFDESEDYTWIVTQYNPESYLIEYTVSTSDRIWFIRVQCNPEVDSKTSATVTYTFTALTNSGTILNEMALEKMYESDLKDWEEAINYYLQTGHQIGHHN